ncbi:MAG: endonuclease NucS [DPANN group archaeon]|nr:endonuclease NucS [DPANN group archaeon]
MDFSQAQQSICRALDNNEMLLIAGNCNVKYDGRAGSRLDEGERLIIVKGDKSFAVHQNQKLTPVNYQSPGCTITTEITGNDTLLIKSLRRKPVKELIQVDFSDISFLTSLSLQDKNKLRLGGMETDIHKELVKDLGVVEQGLVPVKRESHMTRGSIDIYAMDKNRIPVVIEVKRRKAGLLEATQLKRYVTELRKQKNQRIRGILLAPDITDKAKAMLENDGLEFRKLNYEMQETDVKLKGLQAKQRGLAEFFN